MLRWLQRRFPWVSRESSPTPRVKLEDARHALSIARGRYADAVRRGDLRDRHSAELALKRARNLQLAAEIEARA